MNTTIIRAARQRAIERQVQRLDRRLAPLQILTNRVSWIRVGVFAIGLLGAWAIATSVNVLVGALFGVAAMFIFSGVVWYHRRLEYWGDTFTIWRAFRSDQIARMTHNWEKIARHLLVTNRSKNLALDLDITGARSLHQLLDTTLSKQASQLLADWLTQDHPEPERVQARQNIVRELVSFARFRERFTLTFRLVLSERLEGERLVHWLSVDFGENRLKWALPVSTGLVAITLVLSALFFYADWAALWVIPFLIYFAFYFLNQSWLGEIFETLKRLDAELDRFHAVLSFLEQINYGDYAHLGELCAPFRNRQHLPSSFTRKIKWVTVGVGLRSNLLLGLILNVVLPWDFVMAYLANRVRKQVADMFPQWVQVCYELDAYGALANFAYVNPDYEFPILTQNAHPIFDARDLGHPLIPHAQNIRNDFGFNAPGELAMLTGSNMAGKSTFLKSIGINLCLAYAGAPVVATHFASVPFRLATCIHITDSVTDGFSYFYAEVQCLKHLLQELKTESDLPLLYLVDEIFRGTNNRERLVGSRAFVQSLLKENGVGLVATHDLELAGLANQRPQIHNYHFRDDVSDGKLVFDYKLHPGPCPTTNALKIMQMAGLPIE